MPTITTTQHLTGVTVLSLLSLTVTVTGVLPSPSRYEITYPFGVFNAYVDTNGIWGCVDLSACSTNQEANMKIAFGHTSQNTDAKVGQFDRIYEYSNLSFITDRSPNGLTELPVGIDLSSDSQIFVYGVQIEIGSLDGFLVPPLTVNNIEFYIAGWPGLLFDSGILVAAAYPDTCVEIYQITNGTRYTRLYSIYLPDDKWLSQKIFNGSKDTTGLYLNSTKPVNVFSSVSCGSVPNASVGYCDYMVEQMLPVSELGYLHIVPVIAGRDKSVGFVVRVVATEQNTTISWKTTATFTVTGPKGKITGTSETVITRSQYLQFDLTTGPQPLLVNCTQKCIVMQYNKGFRTAKQGSETVRSDPFMMLTVPVDHFVNATCFQTPEGAEGVSNRIVTRMVNYVSIVTRTTDKASILLDGSAVTSSATWLAIDDYSVGYIAISDGWHSIIATGGAAFIAYVYGHAPSNSSTTQGYGYPVAYRLFSALEPAYLPPGPENLTKDALTQFLALNLSCQQMQVATGGAVVSDMDQAVNAPIALTTSVTVSNAEPLTDRCRNSYTTTLQQLLLSVSRDVNTKICLQLLCPYLSNTTNPGVLISPSSVTPVYVFAAIDVTQVSSSVKFITSSADVLTIRVDVPFYGIYNTTVESFQNCRMEVREHLSSLENWLTPGNGLTKQHPIATPPGCPELTFHPNMTTANSVCDVWTGTP